MFKLDIQYFVKTHVLTLLVFNYFPTEDLSIRWNIASLIISLILYIARMYRFTSIHLLS